MQYSTHMYTPISIAPPVVKENEQKKKLDWNAICVLSSVAKERRARARRPLFFYIP